MPACSQCGAEVEQGIPFCPECRAPQIRVGRSEAEPAEVSCHPSPLRREAAAISHDTRAKFDRRRARRSSLIAGGVLVAVMLLPPLAPFAVLWMLLAGALSAALYQRGAGRLTVGGSARLGVTTGFFAFAIMAVMSGVSAALARAVMTPAEIRAALQAQLERALANNPDPAVRQTMEQMLLTPHGMVLAFVSLFIGLIILCGIGGMLGGLFGMRWRK